MKSINTQTAENTYQLRQVLGGKLIY